jgi:hypothetical protein
VLDQHRHGLVHEVSGAVVEGDRHRTGTGGRRGPVEGGKGGIEGDGPGGDGRHLLGEQAAGQVDLDRRAPSHPVVEQDDDTGPRRGEPVDARRRPLHHAEGGPLRPGPSHGLSLNAVTHG